ncbi:MAG: hypothetical protein WAL50_03435 [Kineosporiaceae bacterium]
MLRLARALIAGFIVINMVLAGLRTDLSLREDQISTYLTGPYRRLAVVAFVLLAVGAALLAVAVDDSGSPRGRRLSVCLAVYSAGVLLSALTHPESVAHAVGAMTAFAVVPVAVVAAGGRTRIWWFVLIIGSFAAWPLMHFGLGERLTVLVELVWLLRLQACPARSSNSP